MKKVLFLVVVVFVLVGFFDMFYVFGVLLVGFVMLGGVVNFFVGSVDVVCKGEELFGWNC